MTQHEQGDPMQAVMHNIFETTGQVVFYAFTGGLAPLLPDEWSLGNVFKDNWTETTNEADYSCAILYKNWPVFELILRLLWSEETDGSQDGWNVQLETMTQDGCIGPGYTPYNYTAKVWTRDKEELERRLEGFVDLIDAYANELNRDFIPHQDLDAIIMSGEEE